MTGLNRRAWLGQASKFGSGLAMSMAAAGCRCVHASSRSSLRIAFIGVGGRGLRNLTTIASDPNVEVVALCDVNRQNLAAAQKMYPDARAYEDFRDLYQVDDFEAVTISTCEHTHAYATIPALQMRKHVYCEKPLTHNVQEARLVTRLALESGVATQMGTQIHASDNYRRVVELIQSGAIGDVTDVHVWVGRAWGLQSQADAERHQDIVHVTERPSKGMPPPDYLNWDLWLGPAAYRPFHEVYFPGPKWYRWWDFGNGTMSDLGSHWNDLPYWALKLDAPVRISTRGDVAHPEIAPASMTAVYEYAAREEMPACRLHWYQGTHKPEMWHKGEIPNWKSGVLFEGSTGRLLSDYRKHLLLPEERFQDFVGPDPFLPSSPGQHEEWLQACREGTPTGSHFGYAGPLTEANHLGNVAFRAGQTLDWDAARMQVTNHAAANAFLRRVPREGWELTAN